MRTDPQLKDPFGPLERVVTTLLAFLVLGVALFAAIAVVGFVTSGKTGVSIASLGDGDACILVSNETPSPAVAELGQRGVDRDVASLRVEELDLCIKDPSPWQQALSALGPVGDLIFAVGGLLLVNLAIRAGRRHGLFRAAFAGRLQHLGWFMLTMTLLWPLVVALGRGALVQEAIPGRSLWWELASPDVSVALVVVSLGVLSMARVLVRGIALQEELDTTV